MKKEKSVHYGVLSPACHTRAKSPVLTNDRRKVKCENCKNTIAWKGCGR
jgi:exosome complex RNA-binding protein Csl4